MIGNLKLCHSRLDGESNSLSSVDDFLLSFQKPLYILILTEHGLSGSGAEMAARIIAISGGTCSGKSSFAKMAPASVVLSTDDFYRDLSEQRRRQDGTIDWEDPIAADLKACTAACKTLAGGKAVEVPIYDMLTDSRVGFRRVEPPCGGFVLVEGLFAFEPEFIAIAADLIFLDVDIEIRKSRRLKRDIALGFSVTDVQRYLRDVEVAEEHRLVKFRRLAHVVLCEKEMEKYWQNR